MAAIETACWDILGKVLKAPIHQLLGGKVRDRIRAYANGWYKGPRDPAFFADRAAEVVAMGYTALKMDPFGANRGILRPEERRLSLAIVEAVRRSVGDDIDIIIEVHDRLTVPEAIQINRRLEEYDPLRIEAPVWFIDVGAVTAVAEASRLRIAVGGHATTLRWYADLLASGRIDLLEPEYVELGGLHRLRQVAALAEAYQAVLAPHNARCMLSTALNVQFDAATRNVFIQETFDDFHVGPERPAALPKERQDGSSEPWSAAVMRASSQGSQVRPAPAWKPAPGDSGRRLIPRRALPPCDQLPHPTRSLLRPTRGNRYRPGTYSLVDRVMITR
jgi:galactonate dehydratase